MRLTHLYRESSTATLYRPDSWGASGAERLARLAVSDVTESLWAECERLRRRLSAQAAALELATRHAESFDYSIAHELRAPLRAVVATSSILLEELGESIDPQYRKLLERQAHNARRFGALIDDLLEYSRLARAEVRRRPVDLAALALSLDPQAIVQDSMWVAADPQLIEIALRCLLENARKFTLGQVWVRQSNGVVVVADEGPGFDVAYAERIFQPFERLAEDAVPGNGVGLALVRRVAERHGGKAWAESGAGGARFCLSLG